MAQYRYSEILDSNSWQYNYEHRRLKFQSTRFSAWRSRNVPALRQTHETW